MQEKWDLPDGEYEGEAKGYLGPTKVSVRIKDGGIENIDILSYTDYAEFFDKAGPQTRDAILRLQSLAVPNVAGATFSARSVTEAVRDAISSGALKKETPQPEE